MIRCLKQIIKVSKEKNIEVTICGEIAGDPHFLPLLIGLGVDALSAVGRILPELKFFGRRFTYKETVDLVSEIKKFKNPTEIKECLNNFYESKLSNLIK